MTRSRDEIIERGARFCRVSENTYIKKCAVLHLDPGAFETFNMNTKQLISNTVVRGKTRNENVTKTEFNKEIAPVVEVAVNKEEALVKKSTGKELSWWKTLSTCITTNIPTMLVGPAGCGKTYGIHQIAEKLGYTIFRVNFDAGMTAENFLGCTKVRVKDGGTETYFQEGPVVKALQAEKGLLLLDEIDRMLPEHACALHPLLENLTREFVLNEDGGRKIAIPENFRIVATANAIEQSAELTEYQSFKLGRAFLDRFCVIQCSYENIEYILSMHSQNEIIPIISKWFREVQKTEEEGFLSLRCVLFFLKLMDEGINRKTAFEISILNKVKSFQRASFIEIWKLVSGEKI